MPQPNTTLLATINNKPFVDFGLDGGGVGLATDRPRSKSNCRHCLQAKQNKIRPSRRSGEQIKMSVKEPGRTLGKLLWLIVRQVLNAALY